MLRVRWIDEVNLSLAELKRRITGLEKKPVQSPS
jgi:hypothetical protein